MIPLVHYGVSCGKLLLIGFLTTMSGCVVVVRNEPPTVTNEHYVTIKQTVHAQEVEDRPPIIQPTPHVIERKIPVVCDVPSFPEAPLPPDLSDVDPNTLLEPEDTEDLLVDYIRVLREYINDREVQVLNYYQRVLDICQ